MSSTPVELRGHWVAEYEEWVKEQRIPTKCRPSATRTRTLTLAGGDGVKHQAIKKNLMQPILLRG